MEKILVCRNGKEAYDAVTALQAADWPLPELILLDLNMPYTFPSIDGDKISLREILEADIKELIEISSYEAVQAKVVLKATELQAKLIVNIINEPEEDLRVLP